jgi:N-acetylglucosamine kinase-like BadF-type ATPase
VSKSAVDGDSAALAILEAAAGELAALACALRERLGFPTDTLVEISWSGSVLAQEPLVRDRFLSALADRAFTFVEPRFEPGHGAALYARKLARSRLS